MQFKYVIDIKTDFDAKCEWGPNICLSPCCEAVCETGLRNASETEGRFKQELMKH